jgi:hypothetical protein
VKFLAFFANCAKIADVILEPSEAARQYQKTSFKEEMHELVKHHNL